MEIEKLLKLKSGTDVRGVAVAGVSGEVTLTDEAVTLICKAYAVWLKKRLDKSELKIALGRDPRISSPRIESAAKAAFLSCGCDVVLCGLCSTPSMFMILQKSGYGCDGSVMITASHLPYERNGLKFFTKDGGLEGADIVDILHIAADGDFPEGCGEITVVDFLSEYCADLVNMVVSRTGEKQPLKGKKIIVDAGNGAGGFYCDKVLIPLGADVAGSQFLEPDGTFPNHIPNPENKQAIDSLKTAVIKSGADLGIIFDTDVDRAACVDKSGEEINRNALIALISAILLKEKSGVIVTDSVASDHLTEFIESRGGKHLRYKRGYKNVIGKCIELNERGVYSPLAIETSGHAAFKENYFLDDGAYLITRILISVAALAKEGESLSSLTADLKIPAEEREVRLGFGSESVDFKKEGAYLMEELKEIAKANKAVSVVEDNYEGVRMRFDKGYSSGWVLVRMSVHDPVIPINFESDERGGIEKMASVLFGMLDPFKFLDLKNLTELF